MNNDINGNTINEKNIIDQVMKEYKRRLIPFDDNTGKEAQKIVFLNPTNHHPFEYSLHTSPGKPIKFTCLLDWILFMKARILGGEIFGQRVYDEKELAKKMELIKAHKSSHGMFWERFRANYIYEGLLIYFNSDKELKRRLISGDFKGRMFAYCVLDTELGVGYDINDRQMRKPDSWLGINLYGIMLTKLRDDIIASK